MKKYDYDELMELTKEYRETFDSLYKLHTQNEGDIDIIYQLVENNLIKTEYLTPSEVLRKISFISICNNRYIKSYWILFKKIFEKYHPREVSGIEIIFNYFAYKEYGIILDKSQKEDINFKQYSLNFHEEDQILRSIVNDDIKSLIPLIENDPTYYFPFDLLPDREYFYSPDSITMLSIIELCCYYGAVDCFKFLRTKFNTQITKHCLYYSFLSGNLDIMHLCLKEQKPDYKCMKYAIISRNIDFVSFLMNEYNININLEYCVEYNNLHAFFVHLDIYKKLYKCFVYSPRFGIPSLCEYFITRGVDVKARAKKGIAALHSAALNKNKRTAEFLISHGADIFAKDKKLRTPFYYAACNNNKDTAELLIYPHCNEMDKYQEKPIDIAIQKNYSEIVNLLISHGIRSPKKVRKLKTAV
ncbi:hypothetical protein TVAG_295300 [Trichomonas vaginalis G3]|uniref:DUF3447 domain-containing protein n=1 Tax=Trichomonas vaginalis (strain ATCC PRA-98 / G3) TaxID=412133 RepID=A2DL87_TRIV3|nr:spermatogenesis [Trichomonas vaginalis G3]EAY18878.1 hypothetical protein TVAG_295300 [Trichomonas vaginalis G3]KAI5526003.1 spermatogenesis [Trichomonas vaginalis G3]|eukprot:XP_001579864.1 hypothetical protein [Trichomonas vaginalis G3]